MKKIGIAVQIWSVRNEFAKDPSGTLKALADMGYEGVEFFGTPAHSADDIKTMLDGAGLVCAGWHTPYELVQDDKLEQTIEFNRRIGNRYVIIPGLPRHLTTTRQAWLDNAAFFNRLAEKLAPHTMLTGYHNHTAEFAPLDGEAPWDTLFSNTRKEVVMQLDTGNAARGGADSMPILTRYPGRAISVHLKPFSKSTAAAVPDQGFRPVIGDDEIPWAEVLQWCSTKGKTKWYIIEYESDLHPPLKAVDRCLKALRKMQ